MSNVSNSYNFGYSKDQYIEQFKLVEANDLENLSVVDNKLQKNAEGKKSDAKVVAKHVARLMIDYIDNGRGVGKVMPVGNGSVIKLPPELNGSAKKVREIVTFKMDEESFRKSIQEKGFLNQESPVALEWTNVTGMVQRALRDPTQEEILNAKDLTRLRKLSKEATSPDVKEAALIQYIRLSPNVALEPADVQMLKNIIKNRSLKFLAQIIKPAMLKNPEVTKALIEKMNGETRIRKDLMLTLGKALAYKEAVFPKDMGELNDAAWLFASKIEMKGTPLEAFLQEKGIIDKEEVAVVESEREPSPSDKLDKILMNRKVKVRELELKDYANWLAQGLICAAGRYELKSLIDKIPEFKRMKDKGKDVEAFIDGLTPGDLYDYKDWLSDETRRAFNDIFEKCQTEREEIEPQNLGGLIETFAKECPTIFNNHPYLTQWQGILGTGIHVSLQQVVLGIPEGILSAPSTVRREFLRKEVESKYDFTSKLSHRPVSLYSDWMNRVGLEGSLQDVMKLVANGENPSEVKKALEAAEKVKPMHQVVGEGLWTAGSYTLSTGWYVMAGLWKAAYDMAFAEAQESAAPPAQEPAAQATAAAPPAPPPPPAGAAPAQAQVVVQKAAANADEVAQKIIKDMKASFDNMKPSKEKAENDRFRFEELKQESPTEGYTKLGKMTGWFGNGKFESGAYLSADQKVLIINAATKYYRITVK